MPHDAPVHRADVQAVSLLHLATEPALTGAVGQRVALNQRDAALLAWLAIEGPTPRSRLAALLWPESALDTARNALRQRMFRLRKLAARDVVVGSATLALAEGWSHDLADSDRVLGSRRDEIGGAFGQWLEQQRERRHARVRQGLIELSDMAEAVSDYPDALSHAHELLALQPLSEAAHRRVIRLHYLAGDRASALLAFDRCERVLKHDVGTTPDAQTLALLRTLEQAQSPPPGHADLHAAGVPAAVRRPPRLVGREQAWRALAQARADGLGVIVCGDGGLGKSRLLADFAASQPGAVSAGARPGDQALPYASLLRLLRALPWRACERLAPGHRRELARLMPELGPAPAERGGPEARTRLVGAVIAAFEAAGAEADAAPLFVFDDLHLADEASLDALQLAFDAAPATWLLATRDAELTPARVRWLDDCTAGAQALRLPLRPLNEAQVAELADSLGIDGIDGAAAAPLLLQRSGGNPLFVLEVLKAWLMQQGATALLPALVSLLTDEQARPGRPVAGPARQIIGQRLARLSPPAVELARCAAVAAPDFSAALAANVLGRRTLELADPWAELEAAQVLIDGSFAHDLIYEAALASVPAAVALQLHAEIAGFLSAHGGEPARLARHWMRAHRWAEAGAALQHAAVRAGDASRPLDQAALLAQAADALAKAGDHEARFAALIERAAVLNANDAAELAVAAVAELQGLAATDLQRLKALLARLGLEAARHETAHTLQQGREALAAAEALGQDTLALRAAVAVAGALLDSRRAPEAVALLEPFTSRLGEPTELALQWACWERLALALDYAGRLRDALPAWEAACRVAQRSGRNDWLWRTLAGRASTLAKTGHVEQAASEGRQALALAQSTVDRPTLQMRQAQVMLAHRLRDLGRLGEALVLLEDAHAAFAAGPAPSLASVEHRLAQLYLWLGQPARAWTLLADARPGLPLGMAMMRLVHRADLAHHGGQDGLPALQEAFALIPDSDDVYHRVATLFASRILAPDQGEALASSLADWASARERAGLALAGHVRAAACALAQDAPGRAMPHVQAALQLAPEHVPDSFYLPELWLVAARACAASGHSAQARRHWQTGASGVLAAAEHDVPAPFRDSFLQRNPVNAALLAGAAAASLVA